MKIIQQTLVPDSDADFARRGKAIRRVVQGWLNDGSLKVRIEPAKGGSSYLYQLTRAGREALRQLEDRVFNVKIACVELIEAPDAASAVAKLGAALIAAGFSPLLDAGPEYASAFESEDS